MNNTIVPEGASNIVKSVYDSHRAGHILSEVNKYLKNSGVKWTCSRIKAIFRAAKHVRSGNFHLAQQIYRDKSIAYRKDTFYPKGPFRIVVRDFVKGQRPIVIRRGAAVLRLYTAFALDEPDQESILESKKSIMSPKTKEQKESIKGFTDTNLIQSWIQEHKSLFPLEVGNANLNELNTYTSYYSRSNLLPTNIPYGRAVSSLVSSTYAPREFRFLYPEIAPLREMMASSSDDNYHTGRLNFLCERGCKVRTIAVPNTYAQLALQPLHEYLDHGIRNHPESVVHDQNRGAWFMIEHFRADNKLYCFDLSSATDRFPWEWQEAVLNELDFDAFASLLNSYRKRWKVEEECDSSSISEDWSYSEGQPMGIYGSFPLFHITHAAVLGGLCDFLSLPPNDSYRVLGDDVIISDKTLAKYYAKLMKDSGVPLSSTKSIISDEVAEFGGFLCIKTNQTVDVFRPYKHSTGNKHSSVVNLIYNIGLKCARKIGIDRDSARYFWNTVPDRSPDLSPLISCKDPNYLRAPYLSQGRLHNLIRSAYSETLGQSTTLAMQTDYDCIQASSFVLLDQKYDNEKETDQVISEDILGISNDEDHSKDKCSPSDVEDDPLIKEEHRKEKKSWFDPHDSLQKSDQF